MVHAVGRIAPRRLIDNMQASWVKLGLEGAQARLLDAGCNDFGGTLMDENISRASGAAHGQLATPEEIEATIRDAGRIPAGAPRSTTSSRPPPASPRLPPRAAASLRSCRAWSISSTLLNFTRGAPVASPRSRSSMSMSCQSS